MDKNNIKTSSALRIPFSLRFGHTCDCNACFTRSIPNASASLSAKSSVALT